ncbi:zinc ribbon domain-containing protein [candidate division WOR-3 bacterium]|nr:zinc ribbon domain-containing protein [candidate division WOR-3 bacterium]
MPTYEYECMECGYRFEEVQGIKDEPLKECPKCGGMIRRLIGTGVGVLFKGKGFYHTDYKINSNNSGDKKEKKKKSV